MKLDRAKLFTHGGSQAVRLPKAFRFEGREVLISRDGDKVILEPVDAAPVNWDAIFARIDASRAEELWVAPPDPPAAPPKTGW